MRDELLPQPEDCYRLELYTVQFYGVWWEPELAATLVWNSPRGAWFVSKNAQSVFTKDGYWSRPYVDRVDVLRLADALLVASQRNGKLARQLLDQAYSDRCSLVEKVALDQRTEHERLAEGV